MADICSEDTEMVVFCPWTGYLIDFVVVHPVITNVVASKENKMWYFI
jgi:hypothetical protein